jgi:hypothetical protein
MVDRPVIIDSDSTLARTAVELAQRHPPRPGIDDEPWCVRCWAPWPCDAAQHAAKVCQAAGLDSAAVVEAALSAQPRKPERPPLRPEPPPLAPAPALLMPEPLPLLLPPLPLPPLLELEPPPPVPAGLVDPTPMPARVFAGSRTA